jgi:hypothetical protein
VRGSGSGRKIENSFLPQLRLLGVLVCGTLPGHGRRAFGTFADPSMPWPALSVWETRRHSWVTFDHQLDRFTVQPNFDQIRNSMRAPWMASDSGAIAREIGAPEAERFVARIGLEPGARVLDIACGTRPSRWPAEVPS